MLALSLMACAETACPTRVYVQPELYGEAEQAASVWGGITIDGDEHDTLVVVDDENVQGHYGLFEPNICVIVLANDRRSDTLAHEFGHLLGHGHTKTGLMAEYPEAK